MFVHVIHRFIRAEYKFIITLLTFLILNVLPYILSSTITTSGTSLTLTITIFIVMLLGIFNIITHADWLAETFGEPYGTLIITLSVITIEVVMIVMVMLIGNDNPTLARDTLFAIIMIAVNGFAGLSLIIGGIKNSGQMYNSQGTSSYIGMIILLVTIVLILPNHTIATSFGTFSIFQSIVVISMCVLLYITFVVQQTITHIEHYKHSYETNVEPEERHKPEGSISYHVTLLILGLLIMILLSKNLSLGLEYNISEAGLPTTLGGFMIALLVLAPEGISSVKAAYNNRLQRSINLCMGSAVATICLTVPSVLIISLVTGKSIILGLGETAIVLITLTFFITIVTFTRKQTNTLNGMMLLSIFIIYFALIFDAGSFVVSFG